MAFRTISGLAACCVALAAPAPAGADSTPAGDFSFQFSSTQPGKPAGLEFRQLYKHPDDPNAKPSPVRRFLFAAPEGAVFDGSAVPACEASDEQFQQMGKAACPAESVVGTGFITVLTGIPGEQPYPLDATVFNSGDGIIELFTEQGTGVFLAIERPKFRGGNAFEDTDVAPTPGGPPDGYSAAREAFLEFPISRGPDGRSFITTPPKCPTNRQWTARFEWTNGDGNSYSNKHDMTCVPGSTATVARPGRIGIARRNLRISDKGFARIRFSCPPGAPATCHGYVALRAIGDVRAAKRIVLARRLFRIPRGTSKRVRVKLSKAGRRVLRRERRLRARVFVRSTIPGGKARVSRRTVTLLAPRR